MKSLLYISLTALLIASGITSSDNIHSANNESEASKAFTEAAARNLRLMQPIKMPILLYHYVEQVKDKGDYIRQGLATHPEVFESQIIALLTLGYEPIRLQQLTDYFEKGVPLPEKPVIFTFDDGYADFYTDVFPLLSKHHIPVVVYIVTDFIDSTTNYLTKQQLIILSRSDLIEIGAHGISHANLTGLSMEFMNQEIIQSKKILQDWLDKPVKHFSYPFGDYDKEAVKLVEQAGFLTAVGTDTGIFQTYPDRFMLKRIKPGNFSGQEFLKLLE